MIFPPLVAIALTIVAFGVLGEAVQGAARVRRRWMQRLSAMRTESARRTAAEAAVRKQHAHPAANDGVGTGADSEVLLRVRDLRVVTHGDRPVALVDGVNFDLRRGEVLGIVGESGAGKSVIVRSMLRASRNTTVEGHALLDGVDLVEADESELRTIRGRRIAYIGQDPLSALDPLFRIGNQLVEAVRSHRRMTKEEAYAEGVRLLKAVHIPAPEDAMRKYPFEISGGQAQRVVIALALAGDPDLLIADEPTTALDVTIQMEVLGLLKDLQRQRSLSIILVTHDWGVVADMADRVLTVYAGEVVEAGGVRDVFKHPAHPYTAALRRADPHLQPEGSRLTVIPGRMPVAGARPTACRFAARCPMAAEICSVHPALLDISDDRDLDEHDARCVRTPELREVESHV